MNRVTLEKTENYLIVKIPLQSVRSGRASISSESRNFIDRAISEGIHDIKSKCVLGPFKNIREFKKSFKK